MQRLVKGATKPKVAAPKTKYIEPLIQATYDRGQELDQAMDALSRTLARSTNWTTSYKALIVLHIMIREGQQDAVLRFISRKPRMIELDEDMARQAAGLGRYARYLAVRAAQFKDTKIDYIRYKKAGKTRLHNLSIAKGLLRECESVVVQIEALLKCKLEEQDVDNDVILMAFRLLVHDLLSLFQVLNEGVINLLEHFFELSRPDAEHALVVYKSFTSLTGAVISYLKTAKNLEYQTKLHVPNIKHAPTSLVSSLEIYLNDPDFETNRRQYVAEKQAHRTSRADLREKTQPQVNRQPTLVQQARRAEESGSTVNQVNAQLERQRSMQQAIQSSQPININRQHSMQSQPQAQSQLQSQPQAQYQQAQVQREPSFDIFAADNSFASNAQQIQMQQAQSQMHTQQLAYNNQNLHQQTSELQRQNTTGFNFGPVQQQSQQTIQPLHPQNTFHQQPTGGYASQSFQPVQPSVQQSVQPTGQQWSMPMQQQQLTGQYTENQQPVHQMSSQHTGGYSYTQPATQPVATQPVATQPVATQHTGGFNYSQTQPMQPMGTGQNPFRASMTGTSAAPKNLARNSYNPFNRTMTGNQMPPQPQQPQQPLHQPQQALPAQGTGMADLIQLNNSYQPQAAMASQHTATNPFHH